MGGAAALIVVAGCGGGSAAETVAPREIVAAPEEYYGEEVRVEADVSRRIDHRVWEMAAGRLFVIFDRGLDDSPGPGDSLRVRGTVHPLAKSTIEDQLGVNIEDRFFDEPFLRDDVALVADDVTRVD